MISKRKRNTILIYCMASVIMLCCFVSNVTVVTTELKTNTKKIVADNNYVETNEVSYGLVAIEASSAIEDNKDAQKVTEKKEEEKKEEKTEESSKETSENKNTSSTSNKVKTAQANKTTTSNKSNSTKKATSNKTTKKNTVKKTTSNKTTSNKTATAKKSTTSTTSKTTNVSSNKKLGTQIASYAKQFVGNPYVHGGTSLTKGADCSGFTQSVFKHFGIKLPRTASSQAKVGKKVSFSELEPGDLVFYSNGGSRISHVAIYIGNGKIVHAQTPRLGIGITTYKIMTRVTTRRVI